MKSKFSLLGSVDEKEVFDRLVENVSISKIFFEEITEKKTVIIYISTGLKYK